MGCHVPEIRGFVWWVLVRELPQAGNILFLYATAFLRIGEPPSECALAGMDNGRTCSQSATWLFSWPTCRMRLSSTVTAWPGESDVCNWCERMA